MRRKAEIDVKQVDVKFWFYSSGPFNVSSFFSAYISVLFFVALFAYHKLANKTKWVKLTEMDLDTDYFHPPPDRTDSDNVERKTVPKWRAWMSKVSGWIM